MIEDFIEGAREELKRADHSLYVSLKYARTVDIMKGTIKRLISAFEYAINDALVFLKEKKKIKVLPEATRIKASEVAKLIPELKEYIDFYFLLKEIDKAEYDKKSEYRKHVTLIAKISSTKRVEVDINTLRDYYNKTAEFISKLEQLTK